MPNHTDNNKRIAKNTLLLYGRMFLMFSISLYTSRVVLKTLGVEDYGIYNVVGGVISMFAFIKAAMNSSTQRYITFYLGKGNKDELRDVFSMALLIHFLIALVVFALGETIGLWFVLNKLVIPEERQDAAMWVYQLSIVASLINIVSIPYNAEIIAHEKMGVFAYVSIIEAVLKLIVVYLLLVIPYDSLKVYAFLIVIISLLIRYIYSRYCHRNFVEAHFVFTKNYGLLREMSSFAGWNLWGGFSAVISGQGLNILLNMFFGPVVNAARGVSIQIQSAVHQFATSFQTALNPQITKTYAANKLNEMHNLIFRSSKFTFVLLFLICLPVILETDVILSLWLEKAPDYASIFVKLMLCITLLDSMANPLMNANAATGKVKTYQLVIGSIVILVLPIAYLCLKKGGEPWTVFAVHLCICFFSFVARLMIVRSLIHLSMKKFFIRVIFPCSLVLLVSIPLPMLIINMMAEGTDRLIIVVLVSFCSVSVATYFLALTESEKNFIKEKVLNVLNKRIKF
ncbi:MAG: lipopolysaccharide biosynthesis protein [Prevotella sp.]|nr:lipopolysaccharide biosynthesis protein [Prevotella sp.]